ncbi:hypothetical protein ACFSX6_18615 [Hymenobacter rubripertinctus]
MEVYSKWPVQRGLNRLPWWAYALFIPAVYSLFWVLHLAGIIPGR